MLRFKKNMFWCWIDSGKTRGLIGFVQADRETIFNFRDKLSSYFEDNNKFVAQRDHGTPTPFDSLIMLFDRDDAERIERFHARKPPTFLQSIFKMVEYESWREEQRAIMALSKVIIETSHDFPGIISESSVVPPQELSEAIKHISVELGLDLYENQELENINIYSNATLGQ